MEKLLIIDDDKGIQKQLKWSLSDYDVVLADDRESAIAAVRRFEPKVVTLDLGLPPDEANASEGLAALQEILTIAPHTKVIVITGANRGIGLSMVEVFKLAGHLVYAVCRNTSPELEKLNVNVITQVDVSIEEDINKLQKALSGVTIDVLICNAGILRDESLSDLNIETIKEQFEVNAIAPLNIVSLLQHNLTRGSKVAMITSRMGSIADNGSGGRYGYRMSKAALNAAAMSLSKDLFSKGIAVGIYHPGYVQTDMVNNNGDISANEAATRIVGLIDGLTLEETGVFKHSNGETLPW